MRFNVGDIVKSKYSNWIGVISSIELDDKIQIVKVQPMADEYGNVITDRPAINMLNFWVSNFSLQPVKKIKATGKPYRVELIK
jgi:hypothetical protein